MVCKDLFWHVAGSMTLASNSLAAGHSLTGVASPVVVQVPTVSAVHAVTLPAPSLPASAVTAVGAAVAKQELRQQQQQSQQVPHSSTYHCLPHLLHSFMLGLPVLCWTAF